MPSVSPPTIAPITFPKPPMMVAAKAFRAMALPIPTETKRMGPTSIPARPPRNALDEGQHDHPGHRDAEQARHLLVLRRRLHLFAEKRILKEEMLEDHEDRGHGEDQDILAIQKHRAEQNAGARKSAGQILWLRAICGKHPVLHQDRCA